MLRKEIYGKRLVSYKLNELWKKLVESIPRELQSSKEIEILNNMELLINKMNDLDENGQRLRYAMQTSGNLSQDDFWWVNIKNIVDKSEKFIDQVLNIDVDSILKVNVKSDAYGI